MAEEIKHDDLIQKGVFKPTVKGAKELTKELNKLEDQTVSLINVYKDFLEVSGTPTNSKDIKARLQVIEGVTKAEKGLNKIRAEKLKLEDKLREANSETIQDNEELKVQLAEQRKANKELAKDKLGLIGVYQKESKRLIKLRKEYKDLVIAQGKETKESKKLQKEIRKLDKELKDVDASAGQFQRNVGNYPETFGNATKSIIATGLAAVGLSASFDGLANAANGSVQGSENLRKVSAGVAGGLQQGANVVASATVDLFNFGKALFDGEKSLSDIGEAWTETSEATDNFGKKLKEGIRQGVDISDAMILVEKATRPLEVAVSRLNKEIAEQSLIAGDSTRSFKAIADAALAAQQAQVKRSNILIALAQKELDIIDAQVKQANDAGGANVQLLDEQTQAVIKLQEARNEAAIEELETEQLLRQLKQDRLERDLDILIDGFDNQKTINERLIADERKSFEERKGIFEETVKLANDSFSKQKEVLAELSDAGINVDELLQLDSVALNERIRSLEQSEIIEGRTLEVIRERRLVMQDLEDIQRDLSQGSLELFNELDQIQQQGQIDATDNLLQQLDLRRNAILTQADFEVTVAGENAEQIKVIRAQMNNDLAELDRQAAEEKQRLNEEMASKEQAQDEAALQEAVEIAGKVADAAIVELERINQIKIDSFDAEIERLEESVAQQQRIANEGGENILAEEKARLQKQTLERKRELQKQAEQEQAIALAQAFVNSFAAHSKDDPKGALGKALTETFLAKGIVKLLTGFYDGTEDTGNSGIMRDEHGAITGYTHANERVLTAKDNKKIGNISNSELTQLAVDHNAGRLFGKPNEVHIKSNNNDRAIIKQMQKDTNELKSALKRYQSVQSSHLDTVGNMVVRTVRDGLTKTVRIKKRKL